MSDLQHDLFALAPAVARDLTRYPFYVRLTNFSDDQRMGKALARLIVALGPPHPAHPDARLSTARIMINPEAFAKEADGTRYSQTDQALALHTDSSFQPVPHELVMFQMASPDPDGGETILAPVRDIAAALSDAARARLRRPTVPFGDDRHAVIAGAAADPVMRYYRRQIDEDAARHGALDPADEAAMDELDAVLADPAPQHRFRLGEGELLLLNNTRVLHGRTAMSPTSRRLMYRVRGWAGCLV